MIHNAPSSRENHGDISVEFQRESVSYKMLNVALLIGGFPEFYLTGTNLRFE